MYKSDIDDDKSLRTSADRVFEALQDAIVRGDIPPGARVGETELAERFGPAVGRYARRYGGWKRGAWLSERPMWASVLRLWAMPR